MIEKYSLVQLSIKRSRTHDKQKPCDTLETSGPGSLPAAARPLPTLRETGRPEGPRNRSHVIQRGHAGADTDTADNRHAYQPPGRPRTQTLPRSLTYRASSLARGCLPNTSDLPNSPSGMGVNRQDVRSSLFALRARRLASGPADAGASGS